MGLSELISKLRPLNLSAVSRDTGVRRNTISRIVNGGTISPRLKTFEALRDYVQRKQ